MCPPVWGQPCIFLLLPSLLIMDEAVNTVEKPCLFQPTDFVELTQCHRVVRVGASVKWLKSNIHRVKGTVWVGHWGYRDSNMRQYQYSPPVSLIALNILLFCSGVTATWFPYLDYIFSICAVFSSVWNWQKLAVKTAKKAVRKWRPHSVWWILLLLLMDSCLKFSLKG